MWSAVEWPVPDQRGKCFDWNSWKQRIERREKLIAGKRPADDAIEIRVSSARGEAVAQTEFEFASPPSERVASEFTLAPKGACAMTSAGTPSKPSPSWLTNSISSEK